MSEVVIHAENISKLYRIGSRESYKALRDVLTDTIYAPFRWLRTSDSKLKTQGSNYIWALKDVSFEIKRGEVVGIIGRNGAGKSTLLKILSRITEPTEGHISICGRIASLLEVGTGFHPELTGRENIYLNGAILGMKKVEINRKFDEIVAFAEVEKFIDTPVKHYSSGMHMRLAFSVAAHLEPEILLVDEVLAVGDIRFQKKCIDKMGEVSKEGRTVLFVSHSMPAITRLCQRTILLSYGRVFQDGPSHQVVSAYVTSDKGTTSIRKWNDFDKAPGDDVVRLRVVCVRTEDGNISDVIDIQKPFSLEMQYDVIKSGSPLTPCFRLFNEEGTIIFTALDTDTRWRNIPRPIGRYTSALQIPGNLLAEGTITVLVSINRLSPIIKHVYERDVIAFQVVDSLEGRSAFSDLGADIQGVVRPLLPWNTIGPQSVTKQSDI